MAETRTCDRCFEVVRSLRDDAHIVEFQVVRQEVVQKRIALCDRCACLYKSALQVLLEPPHRQIRENVVALQRALDIMSAEGGDDEKK